MPEYLAPGVFVEEIDIGAKPIEGVSTSTVGMVGVTERGPLDVPILLTSSGEYQRWFGERLSPAEFGEHCFLPYAVEGFFVNGGKRLYLTRVLDREGAVHAATLLFDRGTALSVDTTVLRTAGENTGTVANPPPIYVLDPAAINPGDFIRIGGGSSAEYREVLSVGAAAQHVSLNFPLSLSHAAGINNVIAVNRTAGLAFTLAQALGAGALAMVVTGAPGDIAALAGITPLLLEIGAPTTAEYRFATHVTLLDATNARVELAAGTVLPYAISTPVVQLTVGAALAPTPTNLTPGAAAGDRLVYVSAAGGVGNLGQLLVIDSGTARAEVRRISNLGRIPISTPPSEVYPAGSIVAGLTTEDDNRTLGAPVAIAATQFTITGDDVAFLRPGDVVLIDPGANQESVTIASVNTSVVPSQVNAAPAFANAHAAGVAVIPAFSVKTLAADAFAGSTVVALANRVSLAEGDLLRIADAPNEEYRLVGGLPNRATTGPDPGNVVLSHPLTRDHLIGAAIRRQHPPLPAGGAPSALVVGASPASTDLLVSDTLTATGAFLIGVTSPDGEAFFHRPTGAPIAVAPRDVTLVRELGRAHSEGSAVVGREALIEVEALDAGAWGNRLRLSVEDEIPGLVSRSALQTVVNPTHIRLASAAGVEAGTILELLDPLAGNAVVGPPLKVDLVDRQANFTITLAGAGLSAAQQAAHAAAVGLGLRLTVRSREFRLTVRLLHQPDPARPTRNDQVIDREDFRNLSLDPRHSRYIERIAGFINGPLRREDRRPEGESLYIRVRDITPSQDVRLGPEALVDVLPTGEIRAARHALEGGDDSLATLTDGVYVGDDNVDPDLRTGIFSLLNLEDISIVAAPGRVRPVVQNALIAQCENMRYRFAVLDGPAPPGDAIADVRNQRQQYDTRYAALYYPWLQIDDPFPASLADIGDFFIPPSGHVTGIYARTDVERGVHKAPANEVIRGITGLRRTITTGQQEILNPFPTNINVIRDFRPNNRAIRVWGGRVITSDPDWKYVNVRRLLIFIERSIDIGLQWVVFEPNADPLWARVRRTISNFLTTVWRNGALEGTKREEAYFVKCDRTTMTQTDIDNGRLIVMVGVAPVKPAEFVIIRIGLWTAHAEE